MLYELPRRLAALLADAASLLGREAVVVIVPPLEYSGYNCRFDAVVCPGFWLCHLADALRAET